MISVVRKTEVSFVKGTRNYHSMVDKVIDFAFIETISDQHQIPFNHLLLIQIARRINRNIGNVRAKPRDDDNGNTIVVHDLDLYHHRNQGLA